MKLAQGVLTRLRESRDPAVGKLGEVAARLARQVATCERALLNRALVVADADLRRGRVLGAG